MKTISVDVDVDLDGIIEEIDDDDLLEEINRRKLDNEIINVSYVNLYELENLYYHGDFDLKAFIKRVNYKE